MGRTLLVFLCAGFVCGAGCDGGETPPKPAPVSSDLNHLAYKQKYYQTHVKKLNLESRIRYYRKLKLGTLAEFKKQQWEMVANDCKEKYAALVRGYASNPQASEQMLFQYFYQGLQWPPEVLRMAIRHVVKMEDFEDFWRTFSSVPTYVQGYEEQFQQTYQRNQQEVRKYEHYTEEDIDEEVARLYAAQDLGEI